MSDAATEGPRTGVRSLFPGYYPPDSDELKRFVTEGLVVLDTNALLDIYRFTDDARSEYVQALSLLDDRLWVPHRTAHEFLDRRTTVIRSRSAERAEFNEALNGALAEATDAILHYAKRRGLSPGDVQSITALIDDAQQNIQETLDEVVDCGTAIDPDCHPDSDPILKQIEEVADGKIGKQSSDPKQLAALEKTWQTRLAAKIPPGYEDAKKGDRSIGDYLVWHQTLEEAKRRRGMRVLMISNEQKPDWVRRDGSHIGPRPELVKEMRDYADRAFHLIDVRTFLKLANEYLSARISESTVDEASRLGDNSKLEAAKRQLEQLDRQIQMAGMELERAHAQYFDLSNNAPSVKSASFRRERDQLATEIRYATHRHEELQVELDHHRRIVDVLTRGA
ncbi:PIN-like domain-containing protein [Nocardia sp. NPDC058480]|uniref:PIN-like domain-containing protein n=1 Tax=Nocardia sp. NPDC058480 TaxID=3346522 RepID=UPI00364D2597